MTDPGVRSAPGRPTRRRWIPFWVLQASELAIAVGLADVAIHVSRCGLLIAGAAAIAGLALAADGPLGVVRICSRSLHLVVAIVVGAVVAVAPVLPEVRPDIEGIIVVEFAAIGLIRLASLTSTSPAGPGSHRARWRTPVIDATATVADPGGAPTPDPRSPAPTHGSGGTPPGGAAARWAGRTAGRAGASGARVAAAYGPVAGARLRQAIRSAGRAVGRATTGSAAPDGTDPDRGSGH